MEKEERLMKMNQLADEREKLNREQLQMHQLDESLSYQEKKDKVLYEEIAYQFKGDRRIQRICSSYQEISGRAAQRRKCCIEEYDEAVERQRDKMEEEESRIRQE